MAIRLERSRSQRRLLPATIAVSLFASVLLPATGHAAEQREPSSESSTEDAAKTFFYEGSARYSAADYLGAIESFTAALEIATRERMELTVRSALLLNLGRAHQQAYLVNDEPSHLRMAKDIYERHLYEAPEAKFSAADIASARKGLKEVEESLAELEREAQLQAEESPVATPEEPKRTGPIALVVSGGALTLGGFGALVYGATFVGNAREQVDQQMAQTESWTAAKETEANQFLAEEKKKGNAWMVAGASMAAIGVGGLIWGAVRLARTKPKPSESAMHIFPSLHASGGSVSLLGRF